MHNCKSLWIKASAKCITVNVNVNITHSHIQRQRFPFSCSVETGNENVIHDNKIYSMSCVFSPFHKPSTTVQIQGYIHEIIDQHGKLLINWMNVLSDGSPHTDLCCSLELNYIMLFCLARGERPPRLSLVSPKGFSPKSLLHLCLAYLGTVNIWQYYRLGSADTTGWELNWAGRWHYWTDFKWNTDWILFALLKTIFSV